MICLEAYDPKPIEAYNPKWSRARRLAVRCSYYGGKWSYDEKYGGLVVGEFDGCKIVIENGGLSIRRKIARLAKRSWAFELVTSEGLRLWPKGEFRTRSPIDAHLHVRELAPCLKF